MRTLFFSSQAAPLRPDRKRSIETEALRRVRGRRIQTSGACSLSSCWNSVTSGVRQADANSVRRIAIPATAFQQRTPLRSAKYSGGFQGAALLQCPTAADPMGRFIGDRMLLIINS